MTCKMRQLDAKLTYAGTKLTKNEKKKWQNVREVGKKWLELVKKVRNKAKSKK